jgi:hypothetical protein
MDLPYAIDAMSRNRDRLHALVRDLPEAQIRWKPSPKRWSVLEVVGHLHDEERLDFRVRLEYLLFKPGEAWPPIDPEGWVTERSYNAKDPEAVWRAFAVERERSLAWLRDLGDPDWEASWEHPRAGKLRAGDIMASWLAHDYLHMRQIVHVHVLHAEEREKGYSTLYAGTW